MYIWLMWLFIPHYLEQVQLITFWFPLFYFTFFISLSPPGSNSTALPRGCTRVCVCVCLSRQTACLPALLFPRGVCVWFLTEQSVMCDRSHFRDSIITSPSIAYQLATAGHPSHGHREPSHSPPVPPLSPSLSPAFQAPTMCLSLSCFCLQIATDHRAVA